MPRQIFSTVLLLILFAALYAAPNFDTTENDLTTIYATTDQSPENQTTAGFNASDVPIVTMISTITPNSTATITAALLGRLNGRTVSYSYATDTPVKKDDGLSKGAIAGIVIGIIVLLCCCGALGCCKEKGHWETARFWVRD